MRAWYGPRPAVWQGVVARRGLIVRRRARALLPSDRVAGLGAVAFGALFVAQAVVALVHGGWAQIGVDFDLYRDATARWLAGGGFYLERQLAGPYHVLYGDVLYPPPILLLLLPFQVLPLGLWYAIPLLVTAWMVQWWQPTRQAWLAIAICLWFPITGGVTLHANPAMWVMAAVALGTRWAAASPLVLLKFTVVPFALVGVGRRAWWAGLGGLVVASLLFLPMWPDYLRVVLNARPELGLLYSVLEFPMLAIPVLAWLGGRRRPPNGARHGTAGAHGRAG